MERFPAARAVYLHCREYLEQARDGWLRTHAEKQARCLVYYSQDEAKSRERARYTVEHDIGCSVFDNGLTRPDAPEQNLG